MTIALAMDTVCRYHFFPLDLRLNCGHSSLGEMATLGQSKKSQSLRVEIVEKMVLFNSGQVMEVAQVSVHRRLGLMAAPLAALLRGSN